MPGSVAEYLWGAANGSPERRPAHCREGAVFGAEGTACAWTGTICAVCSGWRPGLGSRGAS